MQSPRRLFFFMIERNKVWSNSYTHTYTDADTHHTYTHTHTHIHIHTHAHTHTLITMNLPPLHSTTVLLMSRSSFDSAPLHKPSIITSLMANAYSYGYGMKTRAFLLFRGIMSVYIISSYHTLANKPMPCHATPCHTMSCYDTIQYDVSTDGLTKHSTVNNMCTEVGHFPFDDFFHFISFHFTLYHTISQIPFPLCYVSTFSTIAIFCIPTMTSPDCSTYARTYTRPII